MSLFEFLKQGKSLNFFRNLFITTIIGISTVADANISNEYLDRLANREAQFEQFIGNTLEPFWSEHAKESFFTNAQQLSIHFAYVQPQGAKKAIVISPGRVEGYLKYKELMFDLYEQGYAVFVIDHQGQGLSSRRQNNDHKGYVEDFNDYVVDLEKFIQEEVKTRFDGPLFFLSHSMGGAIGLRYLEQYPNTFEKAVFSSPMWGLESGPIPKPIAKGLVDFIDWSNGVFSDQSPYFIGGKDYTPPTFEENVLTHSTARYSYFRNTYEKVPQLQLGSVTVRWISESAKALEQAYENLGKVKTPLLVMQSGNDRVIDNTAQDMFCERLSELNHPCEGGAPFVVENAEHELFIEKDEYRVAALSKAIQFFAAE